MEEAIKMEIRYQEKGYISSKRVEETQYLFLDISRDPQLISEYQDSFEKDIKKAMSLFSKQSLYNVEITFYSCTSFYNESRYALVCRESADIENDVYTLYKYDNVATDKAKVSKTKLIKDLIATEREQTVKLIDKQKFAS